MPRKASAQLGGRRVAGFQPGSAREPVYTETFMRLGVPSQVDGLPGLSAQKKNSRTRQPVYLGQKCMRRKYLAVDGFDARTRQYPGNPST